MKNNCPHDFFFVPFHEFEVKKPCWLLDSSLCLNAAGYSHSLQEIRIGSLQDFCFLSRELNGISKYFRTKDQGPRWVATSSRTARLSCSSCSACTSSLSASRCAFLLREAASLYLTFCEPVFPFKHQRTIWVSCSSHICCHFCGI